MKQRSKLRVRNQAQWIIVAALFISTVSLVGQVKKDYTSKAPQYTFSNTLEEQEKELAQNPMLLEFAESRAKLANDPHRPVYHYVNPQGSLNDPNGLCYWQGRWHLFYQAYPLEDIRQHWGHAVSDDLIHWKDLPLAIYPNPEEKCFSGATFVEKDRVIATYHGVGAGTMIAISDDPLLLNWEKVGGEAVIPVAKPGETLPYAVFDPFLWKEGEYYYMLTGGSHNTGPNKRRLREEFLHRSKDLLNWEYMHPFLENDRYNLVGDDGACPYFWPIGKDKHILLHYSHMSGGKYIIGDYDTQRDKFVVSDGGDFNFGASNPGGVHAPSAAPLDNENVITIFNMNPAKPTKGWNQIMTLPRQLSYKNNELFQIPAGDIESLRYDKQSVDAMTLPANEEIVLPAISGNAIEIVAEIDVAGTGVFEMNVLRSPDKEEYTKISFYRNRGFRDRKRYSGWTDRAKMTNATDCIITLDNAHSSIANNVMARPPESAPFHLDEGETLKLRIFIDKSVVEVFANDKQVVAARVYPEKSNSTGISLKSTGNSCKLISLNAWQMKNIWE
jgi:beta-fructofuranosidase